MARAGAPREDAALVEVTGLLHEGCSGDKLDTWPAGMWILVRREPIEEGTQLSLFEQLSGYRYQPLPPGVAAVAIACDLFCPVVTCTPDYGSPSSPV